MECIHSSFPNKVEVQLCVMYWIAFSNGPYAWTLIESCNLSSEINNALLFSNVGSTVIVVSIIIIIIVIIILYNPFATLKLS